MSSFGLPKELSEDLWLGVITALCLVGLSKLIDKAIKDDNKSKQLNKLDQAVKLMSGDMTMRYLVFVILSVLLASYIKRQMPKFFN